MKKRLIHIVICLFLLSVILFPKPVFAGDVSYTTLKEIYRYAIRYKDVQPGGIVLAGSSSLSRWNTAASDIASYGVFSEEQVHNFGIYGAKFQELLDQRYITAIANTKPSVIVVYGANSLTVSRKKASRNRSVVNQATNATVRFIVKTRAALLKRGVTDTRFLLVSTVKTPYHYKSCKAKGNTCNIWKRIDLFNKRLKKFAASASYCDYIDIEQYFYTTVSRQNKTNLRFYISADTLQDDTKTASAKALIKKTAADPLLTKDLNHPSALAYTMIWSKVAEQASGLKGI